MFAASSPTLSLLLRLLSPLPVALGFDASSGEQAPRRNVLGGPLVACCTGNTGPIGGYMRDGMCRYVREDRGQHLVCAKMTADFLRYSQQMGNDLSTPRPDHHFVGLKPGDTWCLCASRWQQAFEAKVAPPVVLAATDVAALSVVRREDLEAHANDPAK